MLVFEVVENCSRVLLQNLGLKVVERHTTNGQYIEKPQLLKTLRYEFEELGIN
jgi:hypothetical protein